MLFKEKLRVGYYVINTNIDGGIARYNKIITENSDSLTINFGDKNDALNPVVRHFLLLLFLFFPFLKIHRNAVNVFWGHAHKLPLFRVKGVSYVVTIHDLVWKVCPQTMPSMRRLTERFFFPIAIRNADKIITVSQSTANDLVKYFPFCADKVRVVPLASTFQVSINDQTLLRIDTQYILFVGTIEPRKNIHNMLRAYGSLPMELKQKYKFILVGNTGWGNIKLDELLVNLNLTSFVEWKSFVNDQELSALYQNAYCLLFPSFYEGFGLPIVEAQSFGVPVITSNVSSMPEVAGDGGLLVDSCSIEGIKNALQELLSDTGLRDSLSQKAMINAQRFSWEKTVNATYDLFSESMKIRGG